MDSVESTTAAEPANLPSDFTPKMKHKKLVGSARIRYKALLELEVPHAEAIELSKKTFAELRGMGYKLKQASKPIHTQRSRQHDALKIRVTSNPKELCKKSIAKQEQMGFKFLPAKMPGKQKFRSVLKGNSPQIPKANEIPMRNFPIQALSEITTQPPQEQPQQARSDLGPFRVGIKAPNPMTVSQLDTLSYTILEKIAVMPHGEGPRFEGYSRKPGWLLITCTDVRSKDWLEEVVPSHEPWPGASLEVIPEGELPKPNIAVVFIPNIDTTMVKQSLSLIRAQNALDTEFWKVVHSKVQKDGVVLTLSIDSLSVESLQKMGLKANLGFHKVQFRLKGVKAHQSGTEFLASNRLPQDQSLPGSSSDHNLTPARKALAPTRATPSYPRVDLPETSEVWDKEAHQPYPSAGSYRRREENHGHSSYSRNEISRDSYSGKEDIEEGDSGEEDITGNIYGVSSYSGRDDIFGGDRDFARGTSYNDRENNRGTRFKRRENIGRDIVGCSGYNAREDISRDVKYSRWGTREDIDGGSSYSSREDINRGAGYSGRDTIRDDIDGSYCGREYINTGVRYSGRKDIRGDIDMGSSYSDSEDRRGDIYRGNCRSTSYRNMDETKRDINQDTSYRGREDIRRDIHRSASYISKNVISRDSGGSTSFIGREDVRDISGGNRYSGTEDIRSNQIQHQYPKRDLNADISGFREERHIREDSPQLPSSSVGFRDRDIGQNTRGLNIDNTGFGGRNDSQIHRQFPLSSGSYSNRNIGEDIRGITRATTGFGGRNNSQIHRQFPPSIGSYENRAIGEDIREFKRDSNGFGGRRDSQILEHFPPSTGSYRDRQRHMGENSGIYVGTDFGSRGDSQIPETSSNRGKRGLNSIDKGYVRGSSGYTAGAMQGHIRGDTQRSRGDNRGDSQRYTRGDQGFGDKGDSQCHTRRGC